MSTSTENLSACATLVQELRHLEHTYLRDHASWPTMIAVFAGADLHAALASVTPPGPLWRFDPANGHLHGLHTPTHVELSSFGDPWMFTAVIGPSITASAAPAGEPGR